MLIMTDPGHTAGPTINSIRAAAKVMTQAEAVPPLYLKLGPDREELRGEEPKFPHVQPPLRGAAQRMH